MSKENFLSQNNVNLIWEVLIEDVLKNRPKEELQQIHEKINQIISPFYENEKHVTNNLMDLNKKFMAIIINYVNKNVETHDSIFLQQPKIITQPKTNTNIKTNANKIIEPITFEELHSQRINEFDQKLSKMQDEFINAITIQVPETPNFKDKADEPINEIEMEVKKMMAQRNYDIEQITKNFSPKENVDNLLKPVDTSIKNEKLRNHPNYQQNNPKLIKINENEIINNAFRKNEIIDLNATPQKRISWEDEKNADESSVNNIFKKFKLVPEMLKENDNELKLKYVEVEIQQMNFKIEEINRKITEIFNILKKNK